MKEFIAYEGQSFVIEWYFDSDDQSQALSYFNDLNQDQQNRLLFLFKRMGDFGKISDITKFRSEGDDIYAFKPKPDRFLCFFQKGRKIIVTNAFVKKQDKLPRKEKDKAIQKMHDYLERVKSGNYYDKD